MAGQAKAASVSIHDVALAAKVSTSTVSRVLNGRYSGVAISEATAERVRAAAAQLRYRPNSSARSLRTSQTQTVGVIVRDLLHPFFAEFLRVIYAVCRERGYHVLVGNAGDRVDEGRALGDILGPDRVDGILLLGDVLPSTFSQEEMAAFVEVHRYVVTVGCRPNLAGAASICVDNPRGVTLALEHLVEMGHRSIAYSGATRAPWSWEDEQRWNTYSRFMEAHGLPSWGPDYTGKIHDTELEAAQEKLRRVLAAPARPTAIFVSNDMSALVLLKAALTCGLRVPDDLSLVGFDGLPVAALSTPGLTTVCQPIEAMGRFAASTLLDMITGAEPPASPEWGSSSGNIVIFPPALVCRESVRRRQM